jgi:imidazole glycerol-phosphate synthase subunit HisF
LNRKRIIPVLLLSGSGLYKTYKFKKPVYIGDPVNTIKIFNDKQVDEIILLDIECSSKKSEPKYGLIEKIASECFVPLTYGGGVQNIDQVRTILASGIEKVSINSSLLNLNFIKEAVSQFGSQSIVASIDYKRGWFGNSIWMGGGKRKCKLGFDECCNLITDLNLGELLLTSIDNEGTMDGYDLQTIERISKKLKIPVVANGGCASVDHMLQALETGADAVAAGSFFVFKGTRQSVLVNYPEPKVLEDQVFSKL